MAPGTRKTPYRKLFDSNYCWPGLTTFLLLSLKNLSRGLLTVPSASVHSIVSIIDKKTMEVFLMKYDMYSKGANKAYQRSYSTFKRRPNTWRSSSRQWDYIIRMVCIGCGKTLGRFETKHGFAYCFNCRKILFPETIGNFKSSRNSRPSFYS